jgi:hypothetical protein
MGIEQSVIDTLPTGDKDTFLDDERIARRNRLDANFQFLDQEAATVDPSQKLYRFYRCYMKLDANITHGSSGSSVLNESGELVGVSTLLGVAYQVDTVDCSKVIDTNDDGSYDEKDVCVPVGGFLNASATLADVRAFLTKQGVDFAP